MSAYFCMSVWTCKKAGFAFLFGRVQRYAYKNRRAYLHDVDLVARKYFALWSTPG